jgi:hypothetical protein
MIRCVKNGCLATLSWVAQPDDPALGNFARQLGWKVAEGQGWICRGHAKAIGGADAPNDLPNGE